MTEIKNLPNMTIEELEQFAKNKLLYKWKKESPAYRGMKRKMDELVYSENSTDDEIDELDKRMILKEEKLKSEIDRMNFLQVIQSL
jgi:hypothetical protein